MNVLENLFLLIFKPLLPIANKISSKWKQRMLVVCFMAMMLLFLVVRILCINENYVYYFWCGNVLMFLIAFFSLDQKLEHLSYRKSISATWISLSILMIISDLLVGKVFFYVGIVFLLAYPMVYFVWGNHSCRQKLWNSFFTATRLFFVVFVIYSLLFRERLAGTRYAGGLINPNMLGIYIVMVGVVYLTYLDRILDNEISKIQTTSIIIEIGFGSFLLFMTQARTSVIVVGLVGFVWFCARYAKFRKAGMLKRFLKYILLVIVSIGICFPVAYEVLDHVPAMLKLQRTYKADRSYVKIEDHTVAYAAEVSKDDNTSMRNDDTLSRMLDTLKTGSLNGIFNDRITIYKTYIKNLDLKGHKKVKYVDKKHHITYAHAHNNILQFGYSYGVLAMLAYFVLNILTLYYSIRYFRYKGATKNEAIYPLLGSLAFLITSITEAIFLPYQCITAFAFWMLLGELMYKDEKEQALCTKK